MMGYELSPGPLTSSFLAGKWKTEGSFRSVKSPAEKTWPFTLRVPWKSVWSRFQVLKKKPDILFFFFSTWEGGICRRLPCVLMSNGIKNLEVLIDLIPTAGAYKIAELNCQQKPGPHQESHWLSSGYLPGPAWQNPSWWMNAQYPNLSGWTWLCPGLGKVWGHCCWSTHGLERAKGICVLQRHAFEEEALPKSI